jgi:hypothetical protein
MGNRSARAFSRGARLRSRITQTSPHAEHRSETKWGVTVAALTEAAPHFGQCCIVGVAR